MVKLLLSWGATIARTYRRRAQRRDPAVDGDGHGRQWQGTLVDHGAVEAGQVEAAAEPLLRGSAQPQQLAPADEVGQRLPGHRDVAVDLGGQRLLGHRDRLDEVLQSL